MRHEHVAPYLEVMMVYFTPQMLKQMGPTGRNNVAKMLYNCPSSCNIEKFKDNTPTINLVGVLGFFTWLWLGF